MTGILHAVTAFIAANPHFAYAAVFLLAFSEALPAIGAVIPGSAVIIAASALVPSGTLRLWPLLIAATVGAIIGDGFSFWLGHRYHRELLARWPLNRWPELITRSEAFFARHGDKSVFIARFTPGVRAFIPLLAGIMHMSVHRFYAANILSALVWAPSHILPGVLVGASIGLFGAAAKPLAILVAFLLALGWVTLQAGRFIASRGYPALTQNLEKARAWTTAQQTWWGRTIASVLDPERPKARRLAILAILLAGAAWLFLGILEDVVNGDQLVRADVAIYRALQDLRSAPGDAVMITVTELGDTFVVVLVTAAVFLWLAWKRAWQTAAFWLAAVAGASALNTVIKMTLHRARPGELSYTGSSAFSFPSGHSTTNMALYGFLAFLIAREVRPSLRPLVALAALSFVLMIALSRLYLGAHWFSDVAGGLAFGTVWLAALMFSYVRSSMPLTGGKGLIVVACLAVGLAGGANIYRHHTFDVSRYSVQLPPGTTMSANQWIADGWQQLPAYRIDLGGETEEPMTLQWAGDLSDIRQALQNGGWHVATPWNALNTLSWFSADMDPAALPVVSRFSSGELPSLTLVKKTEPASRLVLRLWASSLYVAGNNTKPVWVGSVVQETLSRPLWLFTIAHVGAVASAARDEALKALPAGRIVARKSVSTDWDGKLWLGSPVILPPG